MTTNVLYSISIGWDLRKMNGNEMLRRRFNTFFCGVIFSFQSKIKCTNARRKTQMLNWLKSHSHSIISSTMHLSRVASRSFPCSWVRIHCVFRSPLYAVEWTQFRFQLILSHPYADVHPNSKLTKCSSWIQNWSNQCDSISHCNSSMHAFVCMRGIELNLWDAWKW